MRILLIHQYFLESNDGGGSRWNEMSRIWALQGHQVTVLAGMVHYTTGVKLDKYKGRYAFDDMYPGGNIRVIRSHVSESYNTNFLGRLWGYFSFVFSSLFAGVRYAKDKYDVIVVTSPPLFVGITAYILSRLKRVPFVFEVRDLWPESAIDTGVVKNRLIIQLAFWFEGFIYRKAKLVNVLTPAFRDALIRKGVPKKKIILIPNAGDFEIMEKANKGFDPDQFRKAHDVDKDTLIVTYVGAHGVANHLEQVLETANLLRNEKVMFWLIGDGMEKQRLKEKAREMQLTNVQFFDPVPKAEVFKYILASDVGASVLKKADAFKTVYSNKTFDYMSCKKPILMVIDGVSKQLIEEAKAGLYVEPENPGDFAEKIRYYMRNSNMLSVHGNNGYQYAINNFDRNVLANRYIDIITGIKKINIK
nr:glycosyltransferase family 4 protein [uncultured Sediminibacterium sp.]